MASDRIFGLVVVIGALAYFAGALSIQTSFLSDPLGPRAFPIGIAVASLLCGLTILARPDAEPDWPGRPAWLSMGVALAVLVAYAYSVVPFGFLVPTAIASAAIGYLIEPKAAQSAVMGVTLSVILFVLFKYGLGLGLFAFPRSLMG
ncbi:MAG: tripartite tricarboxylate transporter TctB family protein [Albidovulum sp.]|jgi:putative tricarboxylic transport membrane protein|nr:tripartite tricarboxylate transporter TctB family protein [uncultured Defluviimonas sp.]